MAPGVNKLTAHGDDINIFAFLKEPQYSYRYYHKISLNLDVIQNHPLNRNNII